MTRVHRAGALAALSAIALLLAPAAGHARSRATASSIIQSDWDITSASGKQVLNMSGSDPGLLDSFTAKITASWRTTTSRNHMLTFSWPAMKITSNFADPATFATIDKTKVRMIGSANGTFEGASGPTPFSCKADARKPPETYLPAGGVPITGGALNATHLGIGALVRPDPRALFERCPAGQGLTVQSVLSNERIEATKPTYTPIRVKAIKTSRKGKTMTLTIKVTEPVTSSAGANVGKVVSTATLHLKFVEAI